MHTVLYPSSITLIGKMWKPRPREGKIFTQDHRASSRAYYSEGGSHFWPAIQRFLSVELRNFIRGMIILFFFFWSNIFFSPFIHLNHSFFFFFLCVYSLAFQPFNKYYWASSMSQAHRKWRYSSWLNRCGSCPCGTFGLMKKTDIKQ